MQRRSFIKLVLGGAASLALPWQPKAAAKPKTLADAVLDGAFNNCWPSGPLLGQLRLTSWSSGDWYYELSEKFQMRSADANCGRLVLENDGEVVIPVDLHGGYWQLDRLTVFDTDGNELFWSNITFPQTAVGDGCAVNVGAEVTLQ